MISLIFQLTFIFSVSADYDDMCWGGSDIDPHFSYGKCRNKFLEAVRICHKQITTNAQGSDDETRNLSDQTAEVHDQSHPDEHLPDHVKLVELNPAQDGTMLNIVHFGP